MTNKKEDYGTVSFEGKELPVTQAAYVSNDGTEYYSTAEDSEGKEYLVTWETTNEWNLSVELYDLELRGKDIYEDDIERLEELRNMDGLVDVEDESNACDWDNPVSVAAIDG